jgi:hypothetical protein
MVIPGADGPGGGFQVGMRNLETIVDNGDVDSSPRNQVPHVANVEVDVRLGEMPLLGIPRIVRHLL